MKKKNENRESVYAKTRNTYMAKILAMPRDRLKSVYRLDIRENRVIVPFFNESLTVTESTMVDSMEKEVSFEILVVVARYLLMCPESHTDQNDWAAFRDFKDAGPLTVYFRDNVEGEIKKHFSHLRHDLKQAGLPLGGYTPDMDLSYDFAMAFDALPRLPLLLLFNFPEDGFPSSCSVLFKGQADRLLDPESLAILGAVFARKLTKTAIASPIS